MAVRSADARPKRRRRFLLLSPIAVLALLGAGLLGGEVYVDGRIRDGLAARGLEGAIGFEGVGLGGSGFPEVAIVQPVVTHAAATFTATRIAVGGVDLPQPDPLTRVRLVVDEPSLLLADPSLLPGGLQPLLAPMAASFDGEPLSGRLVIGWQHFEGAHIGRIRLAQQDSEKNFEARFSFGPIRRSDLDALVAGLADVLRDRASPLVLAPLLPVFAQLGLTHADIELSGAGWAGDPGTAGLAEDLEAAGGNADLIAALRDLEAGRQSKLHLATDLREPLVLFRIPLAIGAGLFQALADPGGLVDQLRSLPLTEFLAPALTDPVDFALATGLAAR